LTAAECIQLRRDLETTKNDLDAAAFDALKMTKERDGLLVAAKERLAAHNESLGIPVGSSASFRNLLRLSEADRMLEYAVTTCTPKGKVG
jgi:predicted DNA-binding protein (UPF0278 family)